MGCRIESFHLCSCPFRGERLVGESFKATTDCADSMGPVVDHNRWVGFGVNEFSRPAVVDGLS